MSTEEQKCSGCKKIYPIQNYMKNQKLLKKCLKCRNQVKEWRKKNKERVSLYNEAYRNDKTDEWTNIKKENDISDKVKGFPSQHRVTHETINNESGKVCCSCKNWKPLTQYNLANNHWDKLRNDCKLCLQKWRKDNREIINEKFKKYEKDRRQTDIDFKMRKVLRSRLGTAIRNQNGTKSDSTINLTGCSIKYLKEHLENKFTDGMTWDNYGEWHIDHIIPCASFNLVHEEEQQKCFHYTNLQPLWAADNLEKGSKLDWVKN
jgi:hypothetical protein